MKRKSAFFIELVKQLVKISPYRIFILAVLSLFSQITLLIAYILPLKILILLNPNNIPNNNFLEQFSHSELIIYLTVLVIIFIIINIICEKAIQHKCKEILKLNIYNGNSKFNKNALLKIINLFASLLFILFSFILILIIYPSLVLNLIIYLILVIFIYMKIYSKKRLNKFQLNTLVNLFYSIGFVISFLWIIFSSLIQSTSKDFILLLITFLLTRQILMNFKKI